MYLLLCGCLPFDDEHSEREIARFIIFFSCIYLFCLIFNLFYYYISNVFIFSYLILSNFKLF